MSEKVFPPQENLYKSHELAAKAVEKTERELYQAHAELTDAAMADTGGPAEMAVFLIASDAMELAHREHRVAHFEYAQGVSRSRRFLLKNEAGYQQQALEEAIEAGAKVRVPSSGLFETALNVKVVPVPEKPEKIPTPEGCISKDDVVAIAHEYGVSPRAVGIGWTRLMQRSVHNIEAPADGLSAVDLAKLAELEAEGIRLYSYQFNHKPDTTSLYYYTFKNKLGKDVEIMRLHDGVVRDCPYNYENERFLIADAFVQAVDEGWLEYLPKDEHVIYVGGLGPKYKRLFQGLADRLRDGLDLEQKQLPSLGYASFEEIKQFAAASGMNVKLVPRIEKAINQLADRNGKVEKTVVETGHFRKRYTDDDQFPDYTEHLELLTPDGKINLDTVNQMCVRGTLYIFANKRLNYGHITDQIVWKFLETKRKEILADQS